jgi:fluoroacetyl-CoA thioesterase
MKLDLRKGISRTDRITIDKDRVISFMGKGASVYSTPSLVQDIEQTCRNLLLDYSDVGEDSVGMEISLQHLAPTLVGMVVDIAVTVKSVDGRKISFEVHAKDDLDVIGVGSHTRFVVDVSRLSERLKAKAARQMSSR